MTQDFRKNKYKGHTRSLEVKENEKISHYSCDISHDSIFSHLLLLFFAVWALLSYDHSISENYLVSLIALVPLLFLIVTDSITRPSVVIAETEWLQSQILWRHNWWLRIWRRYESAWLKLKATIAMNHFLMKFLKPRRLDLYIIKKLIFKPSFKKGKKYFFFIFKIKCCSNFVWLR